MRKFETLLLFSPELSTEERETILTTLSGIIEREEGSIVIMDQWGMRDLAYPVQKQMRGYYVRMEYIAKPSTIAELERIMRITEGLFKFMTIKLEEVKDGQVIPEVQEVKEGA